MRQSLPVFVAMVLLVAFASIAAAQDIFDQDPFEWNGESATPDGEPPSVEDVCDGQTGAAFGLCNAYCEAMDCDSGDPQASQKACDRVSGNFTRLTGEPLPCDCPCVAGLDGWLDALNGDDGGLDVCLVQSAPGNEFVGLVTGTGRVPGSQSIEGVIGFCGFAFGTGGFLITTPEEGANCNTLVRAKADAAGLECQPL